MATSSPYQAFAKTFAAYQDRYAEAGPSTHLDSPLRHDVVLDEEGGVITTLMRSLEDLCVLKGLQGDTC